MVTLHVINSFYVNYQADFDKNGQKLNKHYHLN